MRTSTLLTSVALALSVGAGAAIAQAPTAQPEQGQRAGQMQRRAGGRRGGPEAMLLKGITLNADQQAQLAKLQHQWRANRPQRTEQQGQQNGANGQAQAGQRGQWRRNMTPEQRQAMQKEREQRFAAIRGILTPDQQRQFDANLAQMKQRFQKGAGQRGQWQNGH